jgi:hypothetical protein
MHGQDMCMMGRRKGEEGHRRGQEVCLLAAAAPGGDTGCQGRAFHVPHCLPEVWGDQDAGVAGDELVGNGGAAAGHVLSWD